MGVTITYEGTLPGSRIEGKVIERHSDGSVTVEHPAGDGWTYRVRAEDIISERTDDIFESLLERMSLLASIPLDARESFEAMLRENFEGAINDDAGAGEDSLEIGDRVLFTGSQGTTNEGNHGTIRDVDGDDVRVRWDRPVASGVTATWTSAERLVKVA